MHLVIILAIVAAIGLVGGIVYRKHKRRQIHMRDYSLTMLSETTGQKASGVIKAIYQERTFEDERYAGGLTCRRIEIGPKPGRDYRDSGVYWLTTESISDKKLSTGQEINLEFTGDHSQHMTPVVRLMVSPQDH